MKNISKTQFLSFLHLFFPRQCAVCGELLQEEEDAIYLKCNMSLPRTGYHLHVDNPAEHMFQGRFPLEHVTSYFFYQKGSDLCRILHLLEYGGCKDLGKIMGRFMAVELLESGFLRGIDVMVPIPLHPRGQRIHGYNQSEYIARGIAAVTGLSLDTSSVTRKRHTETQTNKLAYERWENVDGMFRLDCPKRFAGKYVLLVDNVLTTGAITTACADAFRGVERMCISVLTLAVTDYRERSLSQDVRSSIQIKKVRPHDEPFALPLGLEPRTL